MSEERIDLPTAEELAAARRLADALEGHGVAPADEASVLRLLETARDDVPRDDVARARLRRELVRAARARGRRWTPALRAALGAAAALLVAVLLLARASRPSPAELAERELAARRAVALLGGGWQGRLDPLATLGRELARERQDELWSTLAAARWQSRASLPAGVAPAPPASWPSPSPRASERSRGGLS